MNYSFGNIAEWKKSGVMNNFGFWNIAEWEKSGVINNDAFWNNAEWEKSGVMNNFGFWTTKTVELDAPPFGTGRIIRIVKKLHNFEIQNSLNTNIIVLRRKSRHLICLWILWIKDYLKFDIMEYEFQMLLFFFRNLWYNLNGIYPWFCSLLKSFFAFFSWNINKYIRDRLSDYHILKYNFSAHVME